MARVLTDRGQAILENMPPYYYDDPAALAVIDVCAREIDRIWDLLLNMQEASCPADADDTYGMLSLWEVLTGLPVQPPGVSLSARQALVMGTRHRKAATGADWAAALTTAMGTANWTHTETPGVRVTISMPYQAGSNMAALAVRAARSLTPAHLDVVGGYSAGFLLGLSVLGDAL